jgi:Protein of unknown function (DUF3048) N-terminal domain/Protein of unknown function (DUF3048) C-terminal domain
MASAPSPKPAMLAGTRGRAARVQAGEHLAHGLVELVLAGIASHHLGVAALDVGAHTARLVPPFPLPVAREPQQPRGAEGGDRAKAIRPRRAAACKDHGMSVAMDCAPPGESDPGDPVDLGGRDDPNQDDRGAGGRRLARARAVIALVVAAATTLAACGSASGAPPAAADGSAVPGQTATSAATPTTTPSSRARAVAPRRASPAAGPAARMPLTGQQVGPLPPRGVLVVKVENTADARPQVGLGSADLVVEELVEGGLTRLAAFFQSRLPSVVGPVRSLRTSDVGVLGSTGGVLAASGGAGVALHRIRSSHVSTALPSSENGFFRAGGRPAPHNLMLRTSALRSRLAHAPRPGPYLAWTRTAAPLPPGRAASSVAVRFSAGHTTRWRYLAGRGWERADELSARRDAFLPATVLVLRVAVRDAGYRDPAGNPVPETVFRGDGQAWLLHGGRAVDARWVKPAFTSSVSLRTAAGAPLALPAGRAWIELLPPGGRLSLG